VRFGVLPSAPSLSPSLFLSASSYSVRLSFCLPLLLLPFFFLSSLPIQYNKCIHVRSNNGDDADNDDDPDDPMLMKMSDISTHEFLFPVQVV
jgi:hypothetical protein